MKQHLPAFITIVLALSISAFTRPVRPFFANPNFSFLGDPSIQIEVSDKTKWVESTLTCDDINEVACSMTVSDIYSHPVSIGGGLLIEVLNTPVDNPQSENILTINVTTGYLDTTPNPDIQYYILASGIGYARHNQSF